MDTSCKMGEEHKNGTDTTRKITERVLTIPNPRAYQQTVIATTSRESKYMKLLSVIEELGCHIKPFYGGRRYAAEEIKNCIINARVLVRECLLETQRTAHKENDQTPCQ